MSGERALPGLGLKAFWTLGSNGYKPDMDENFRVLSLLCQAQVLSRVASLPGSPTNGDIYLLTSGAHDKNIAIRDNGAWVYYAPRAGWRLWSVADVSFYTYDGTVWNAVTSGSVTTFLDTTFGIFGSGDATKIGAFEVDTNVPTATTVTLIWPASGGVIATQAYVATAVANISGNPWELIVAVGDESTSATVVSAAVTFRMPRAVTLSAVYANVTTAATGGTLLQLDVKKNGVSIFSTKITLDATEKTSVTAATPAVLSTTSISADDQMTVDVVAVGSTIAGSGIKINFLGAYT